MPLHYAKSQNVPVTWARIKPNGEIQWGKLNKATAFTTEEELITRVLPAMAEAIARLAEEREAAIAAFAPGQRGSYFSPPSWTGIHWLHADQEMPMLTADQLRGRFTIDTHATLEDTLGSFELFYARCERGWLGGPRTKAAWGGHDWHESFSDAKGFASEAAARDAAHSAAVGAGSITILKSMSAFTQAVLPKRGSPDPISLAVRASCEARSIEADIQAATHARALAAAGSDALAQALETQTQKSKARL